MRLDRPAAAIACVPPHPLPPLAVAPWLLPLHRRLDVRLEMEGRELAAVALVELVLELDPVQAYVMQAC